MNKKLHILFLCSWLPSRVRPTDGDFIFRHAQAISTLQNVSIVHVITDESLKENYELNIFTKDDINIYIGYLKKFTNPLVKMWFYFKIYKLLIRKVGIFNLIHVNVTYPSGLIALFYKIFYKKKYIVSEHWTDYEFPLNKKIKPLRKLFTKLIIRKADLVCPVSYELENAMISFGLKGKYKVISNVIDTKIFIPKKTIKRNSKFTLVHISNLYNPQKNIFGILNVIKRLSELRDDFVFKIIGNGDPTEFLAYKKNLGLTDQIVQFEPGKEHKDIAAIYQNADLYVSFSNYETFGIVLAEAIACGTPVVATNTGIAGELDKFNCKIIDVGDEDALLDAIQYHLNLNSPIDTKTMHNEIKRLYSINTIANSFSNQYNNILKN